MEKYSVPPVLIERSGEKRGGGKSFIRGLILFIHFPLFFLVPIQNVTILEAMQDPELPDHSFVLPAVVEGNSLTATCIAVGGKRIINSVK